MENINFNNTTSKETTMRTVAMDVETMINGLNVKIDELDCKLEGHKKNPDYYKTQREMRTLTILRDVLHRFPVGEELELIPLEQEWFNDIVSGIKTSKVDLPQEGEEYLPFLEAHPSYNLKKLQEKLAEKGLTCKLGKVVRL